MALINFIRDDKGVTAIEYGLIAALIAVAVIAAATALGAQLSTQFQFINQQLQATSSS